MHSLFLLSICAFALGHKIHYNRMPDILPTDSHGRYIIKFKDAPSVVRASSFIKAQAANVSPSTLASISSAQGIEPDQLKYGVSTTYNSTFLNAMAVTLSKEDIDRLKKRHGDGIDYIEPDLKVYASGTQQNAPWGLARVGQRGLGSLSYRYPDAAGEGIDVYVLDTGLIITHPSFGGRAKLLKNFVIGSSNGDPKGHGTHVAGTIGSSKYGIAKKANIFGIKIMGDNGSGSYSNALSGIEFVTARAKPGKTVINMSLGGPKSQILDDTVAAARKAGVLVVVAAGNENQDACKLSPANSRDVITVGAIDQNDRIAKFPKGGSNWGRCVDIFAPGVNITSLGNKGKDDSAAMNGTSMAAPHVTGIAAIYMSMKSYRNPSDVEKDILSSSYKVVKGDVRGARRNIAHINAKLE